MSGLDWDGTEGWDDAPAERERPVRRDGEPQSGWYFTSITIAVGLVAIWVLHGWFPGVN